MIEFVGLLLIAFALLVLTVGERWYRRRRHEATIRHFMLGDALALAIIAPMIVGGAMALLAIVEAFAAGETGVAALDIAALVIFVAVARLLLGWAARRAPP